MRMPSTASMFSYSDPCPRSIFPNLPPPPFSDHRYCYKRKHLKKYRRAAGVSPSLPPSLAQHAKAYRQRFLSHPQTPQEALSRGWRVPFSNTFLLPPTLPLPPPVPPPRKALSGDLAFSSASASRFNRIRSIRNSVALFSRGPAVLERCDRRRAAVAASSPPKCEEYDDA